MRIIFKNRAIEAIVYLIAMALGMFMALSAVTGLIILLAAAGQLIK